MMIVIVMLILIILILPITIIVILMRPAVAAGVHAHELHKVSPEARLRELHHDREPGASRACPFSRCPKRRIRLRITLRRN